VPAGSYLYNMGYAGSYPYFARSFKRDRYISCWFVPNPIKI